MTRQFSPIYTAIWDDPAFRALTAGAQRAYLLLVSQPDITAAGTLALTVRRWAGMAVDTEPKDVGAALRELVAAEFIVADQASEELLVRSFVRWDKAYGNPRRRPAILAAARIVRSVELRRVLAGEFARVGLPVDGVDPDPDSHSDRQSGSHTDSPSAVEDTEEASPQVESHSDRDSDRQSESLSDSHRFLVPVPGSLQVVGGQGSAPQALENLTEPTTAQEIVGAWIDGRKTRPNGRVLGQVAKQVKVLLGEGADPAHVHAGLTAWQAKQTRTADGISPSALASFVDAAANAGQPGTALAVRGGAEPDRPGSPAWYDRAMARARAKEATGS